MHIARSSKGRTEAFEAFNLGSIPSLATSKFLIYYNDMENKEQAKSIQYGIPEWFKNRAKESLIKIDETSWDFSDSALFWTDEVVQKYEDAQTKEGNEYKKHVTDAETLYLQKITPNIVDSLPAEINYIDLGPGTENKQDYFIHKMKEDGKSLTYTPVDISKRMVDAAAHHVAEKGVDVFPVNSSFEDMEQFIDDKDTPRFISLGLTFLNFKIEEILGILKKSMNKNGKTFINTQPREKVKSLEELKKAYSGESIIDIYNQKLKLIGLETSEDIGTIEVTDEVKIYFHVNNPTEYAQSLGIKAGDKIFVFQSMRYPTEFLKSKLEEEFDCEYFETGDDYLAVLLKNK